MSKCIDLKCLLKCFFKHPAPRAMKKTSAMPERPKEDQALAMEKDPLAASWRPNDSGYLWYSTLSYSPGILLYLFLNLCVGQYLEQYTGYLFAFMCTNEQSCKRRRKSLQHMYGFRRHSLFLTHEQELLKAMYVMASRLSLQVQVFQRGHLSLSLPLSLSLAASHKDARLAGRLHYTRRTLKNMLQRKAKQSHCLSAIF